jgi:hypothetical protein
MKWKELLSLIGKTLKLYFSQKPFLIIFSAFLLLMLWGYHGNLELLKLLIPSWTEPGSDPAGRKPILPWVPWDRELISFWGGAFLVVVIPILIIRFFFKEPLRNYGLALPPKEKRTQALGAFLLLMLLAPTFYIGSLDKGMQATYPFYKNFSSVAQFIVYEASYFPFFIAIEFIFRGYLLFGLAGLKDSKTADEPKNPLFIGYGVAIQMLPYTVWHLGKPLPELWGTPLWGLATGILTYHLRSIWPVTFAHWALNVLLDGLILHHLHKLF